MFENILQAKLKIIEYGKNNKQSYDYAFFKVIPLKLFYYQTFFETWRNEHS